MWTRPSNARLKIKVDVGYYTDVREGTTGLVIRNHNGELQSAQALWYENAASSLIMEARAVRDGVQFAVDRHLSNVDIETDASEVIKLLEDPGGGRAGSPIIAERLRSLVGSLLVLPLALWVGLPMKPLMPVLRRLVVLEEGACGSIINHPS